jgi:hypothetical protein
MVVYPNIFDQPYLTPGFSFILIVSLNLLKNQFYNQHSLSDTSHKYSDKNNPIKLSEEKGNSTRRLFSKSNTFFTQEEENKEGADTVPYNSNANEQSMSQATEPRFHSIEQAQGR